MHKYNMYFLTPNEHHIIEKYGWKGVDIITNYYIGNFMSGTKSGGKKAALTNKIKHGSDYYARIGRKGGQNGHTGGFAANPELAKLAGRKGGLKSRRGPAKLKLSDPEFEEDKQFLKRINH